MKRILNKVLTEEERDGVLATIEKTSIDVTDIMSELAAIVRALMLTYVRNQNDRFAIALWLPEQASATRVWSVKMVIRPCQF